MRRSKQRSVNPTIWAKCHFFELLSRSTISMLHSVRQKGPPHGQVSLQSSRSCVLLVQMRWTLPFLLVPTLNMCAPRYDGSHVVHVSMQSYLIWWSFGILKWMGWKLEKAPNTKPIYTLAVGALRLSIFPSITHPQQEFHGNDEITPSPRYAWNTSWHKLILYDPVIYMDLFFSMFHQFFGLGVKSWQWLKRYSGLLPWHGKSWERS